MRRLSKRWDPLKTVRSNTSLYRTFLSERERNKEYLSWGCIEAASLDGPFRLEIWDGTEQGWEFVQEFPTLKKAKEVGRLLAGVALNKNI
jgi:hypothetical protein